MNARRLIRGLRSWFHGEQGSIVEAVAATFIVVLVGTTMAYGAMNDMRLISGVTAQTERQNAVSAFAGERDRPDIWGTAAAPKIRTVELPSTATKNAKAALWATSSEAGITYYASMPKGGDVADPDSCLLSTAKDGPSCTVASQFQALTVNQQLPSAVVRKDPSGKGETGTVHESVATSTAIPQEGVITSFTPTGTGKTAWRYLVKARDGFGNPSGTLRFIQNDTILADIPTDGSMENYFGTIVTTGPGAVKLVVANDPNIVNTVLIYAAAGSE
jgi:hypothetical protein